MIGVSARFLATLAESRQPLVIAQVMNPGVPDVWVGVTGGQVTCSRTAAVRYTCDITVQPGPYSPNRTRFRLWVGVLYSGVWTLEMGRSGDVEFVPIGTYRVDDAEPSVTFGPGPLVVQSVKLIGLGYEAYCMDDSFFNPGYFAGGSALLGLQRFVGESVRGFRFEPRVADAVVGEAWWDTDRWGPDTAACQMLARSLGAEVFFDAMGDCVVRPTPGIGDLITGRVVGGPGGTLIGQTRTYSRSGAANVISASSSRTDGSDPLYSLVWDTDPYSPTFLHRTDPYVNLSSQTECTFGRSVMRVSSPLPTTQAAMDLLAQSYLADNKGLLSQTGVSCLPDPTVEAGDVRTFQTELGEERHLIEGFTFPLEPGEMSLSLRSTRVP